ncbi:alpha/beta fold hydrolase [Kineosporia sp. R_H_3]|uniref:alpha/beta fold hydrolase n=1 Tax=Kineosporia sp. R_H_3 TaxID=1961848 RepID=UPI000B4C0CE2|nr:alpha/beta fold hydrolase [Kineosporia sp. R_H_3]
MTTASFASPTGVEPRTVRVFGEPEAGGHVVTGDHWVDVPLDHTTADGPRIAVYAREVRRVDKAAADLPYLLFLQGGPGGRSPLPGVDGPGWLSWALERYRVVLLDQRGTGRSTPQDRRTLARLTPREQADRLAHFRADAIVADAEVLRRRLLGDIPWTTLGQSYGGFCTWTYLSFAPEGLAGCYVTGGIPPVGVAAEDVYRATHRALDRRIAALDAAHPRVRAVLADVAAHLVRHGEYLPTGERLTARRLQEIGTVLGSAGGIDLLAHLADDAWAMPGRLSDTFLAGVAGIVSYARNPLYALVHEAIYAETGDETRWAAQRVRDELGIGVEGVPGEDGVARLPLTGEMVYPHTVTRDPALAPLAEAAHLLAETTWDRPLYDRARLARSTVPVAACLYTQDMYVDPDLSRATAAATGGVRVVEDAVHHHDGLRRAGDDVLGLLDVALGAVRTATAAVAG